MKMHGPHISLSCAMSMLAVLLLIFDVYSVAAAGTQQTRQQIGLNLQFYQINDEKQLFISLSDENNNSHGALKGIAIDLFLNENSEYGKLGSLTTDESGKGIFKLDSGQLAEAATFPEFTFIASLQNNELYNAPEAELFIQAVDLTVDAFIEDDIKIVHARLMEHSDHGEMYPVEWEELLFEVQRLFGNLPVEEFTFTDDYGEAVVEYPDYLPGDDAGNIIIVVRLEDHPDYGNVEVREKVAWGVPLVTGEFDKQRTWMSEHPPRFFAIIFWGSIFAVWGTIGYVVFNVLAIKNSTKT